MRCIAGSNNPIRIRINCTSKSKGSIHGPFYSQFDSLYRESDRVLVHADYGTGMVSIFSAFGLSTDTHFTLPVGVYSPQTVSDCASIGTDFFFEMRFVCFITLPPFPLSEPSHIQFYNFAGRMLTQPRKKFISILEHTRLPQYTLLGLSRNREVLQWL